MSRKKKRPLPPRTLRMDRAARLHSARPWLATQRGRPVERIARSYRRRYGVDWKCAIAELTALGITFPAQWLEEIARAMEDIRLTRIRRKAKRSRAAAAEDAAESDATFAFIAGYTDGGAPYGVTWEELTEDGKLRTRGKPVRAAEVPPPCLDDFDQLPF